MAIIYVLFYDSCDLCIQLVTLFNLFVTYQLGTLFEEELSLDESDSEKMCMVTWVNPSCIVAKSKLIDHCCT